ncbi:MAG: serine/threonine protein kinase [Myxococcales bacterium]|nr:serine/threonine protein kinase [Myxococcales bacterium]
MVAEAQQPQERGDTSASLAERCSDLELHRIDLIARLLALKDAALNPEAILVRTAAETRRSYDRQLDAVLFMAGMLRISSAMITSDDPTRALIAGERLADLLAALDDPSAVAFLRGLRRRGELERPPPLDTQRLLRRACGRGRPHDVRTPTREPLPCAAWDALLDSLARSVAVDRDAEVQVDIQLDNLDPTDLARRRDWVRAAITHGETVVALTETGPTDVFDSTPLLATGGDGWAPPERSLLPAGHRIGRFTLLQKLGDGAMGVVYAAYDPELDRRIAVKLLRARIGGAARAQARLLREAQAMARVAHPNVAVVHDVGTLAGDVFVAMEFVRGHTLQAWLKERPRTWQEVVEVFVQAGRGLAAAHAAGLVHRDFKPTNAMIGEDGRVRVLDFGLCYSEAGEDLVEPTLETATDVRITRRGDIVGTPAYMPPEQYHRGGDVGPSADQFSFCASLYEALYERLPFAGETIHDVAAAVARGEVRPPPKGRSVPAWLHAVVMRGLRAEPHARFPSMDALLQSLDRSGSNRTRRGAALAVAFSLAAGVGGFFIASSQAPEEDRCSGGDAESSAVWDDVRRARAEQAIAAAGPAFAEEVWPRVSATLDDYAAAWKTMHRGACESRLRGELSDALFDRRTACLALRRAALDEAVGVIEGAGVALRALEVVSQLPPLDRCADLAALAADVPPPADPAVRAAVDALRPRLTRVEALEHAGQAADARALADELVREAETLGERSLLAEALLQRGRLDLSRLDLPREQDAILTRAYLTALGGRLDELAAEALALRIYVRGRAGNSARALEDLPVAQEMVARLPSPARVDGLLLNNAGVVHMLAGDTERAAAVFRAALAAREAALGREHVEVAYTLLNLALVCPPSERLGLIRRALAVLEAQLGRAHPRAIEARFLSGNFAPDPRDALALVSPACETLARFTPDDVTQRARCLSNLGHHAEESGDAAAAAAAFREVDVLLASPALALPAAELAALRGRAALYTGESRDVLAPLRDAIAPASGPEDLWQRTERGEAELLLGLHLQRLGDQPVAAGEALRAAIRDYEAVPADDIPAQQRLAVARTALADLLMTGPPAARLEAADLRTRAEQWYRSAGPGYAWRLDPRERGE